MNKPVRGQRTQIRCAIYTRKSSEEGLDQAFNSLDAQREACEAYVRSQAHEGWRCLPNRYDDGGHSGGTLERPAVQALMEAVRTRQVDVIVIYKIDRLTRSLADFARLAELFDQHGVSFVSVTQQFNTTTSMGRLMLNVLLSFAQFEREITGERIRDKIAASKKKGLWMGGTVPIGYDVVDRQLEVNPEDAETVRSLFQLYLETGNVSRLMEVIEQRGIRTKTRIVPSGTTGGRSFQRGHLYRLLSNPVYIGRIPHKQESYPGQHPAIVDPQLWEAVQNKLAENTQGARKRRVGRATSSSLLAGLLVTEEGHRFIPSHATKQGRRYRYYVEQRPPGAAAGIKAKRIPASEIEQTVRQAVLKVLADPAPFLDAFGSQTAAETDRIMRGLDQLRNAAGQNFEATWAEVLQSVLRQVIFSERNLRLVLDRTLLGSHLGITITPQSTEAPDATFHIDVPTMLRTRGQQLKLVVRGQAGTDMKREHDTSLIKVISRGQNWFERLKGGETVGDIAKAEGVISPYVTRVIRLAFIAPEVIEQVLDGTQSPGLTADRLTLHENIPLCWKEQSRLLACSSV